MNNEERSIFISGNTDLSEKQFIQYYLPLLKTLIDDETVTFRLADDTECSKMCIKTFEQFLKNKKRVIIYSTQRQIPTNIPSGYNFIGGFKTMEERDAAMTITSDSDIHIILSGKGRTSVEKNLIRRNTPEYPYAKYIATGYREFWTEIFNNIAQNVQSE